MAQADKDAEAAKSISAKMQADAMFDCFALLSHLRYPATKNDDMKQDANNNDVIDIDKLIDSLIKEDVPAVPDKATVLQLVKQCTEIFTNEGTLLELESSSKDCEDMTIVGPVAGHYSSLMKVFKKNGFPSEKKRYLFLGRYVNRGEESLQTLALLLAYKIKYPNNIWLLRGNHECLAICTVYGLFKQCKENNYKESDFVAICDCFDCLPFAAILDKKIFCVSGGISDKLKDLKEIKDIKVPCDVPAKGLLTDLLWADPDDKIDEWGVSPRGAGVTFGEKAVLAFCKDHGFDLIVRGLQVVNDGYEEFGKEKKLITLFTAEKYCNAMDNKGGFMTLDKTGKKTFYHL